MVASDLQRRLELQRVVLTSRAFFCGDLKTTLKDLTSLSMLFNMPGREHAVQLSLDFIPRPIHYATPIGNQQHPGARLKYRVHQNRDDF